MMSGLNRYLAKYRALYEEQMRQVSPEAREKSHSLRAAFAQNDTINLQDSFRFAHILYMLAQANSLEDAIDVVSATFENSKMHASALLMQAVNHAPEEWKSDNEEGLYEKGLLRGTSQFFKVKKFLGKDDIFGRHRPYVPAELRPVLDVAIDRLSGAESGDSLRISPTVLCLMTAYMVPEEMGAKLLKDFESRKEANGSIIEDNLHRAREAISILFKQMDVPLTLLSPLAENIQDKGEKAELGDQLERRLNGLGNAISEHEKNVYIAYVKNKTGNSVMDAMRVASLFNKSTRDLIVHKEKVTPEFLRATITKVEKLLNPAPAAKAGEGSPAKALAL